MRQKYIISKSAEAKELTIQEYAIVDNDSYRKDKYLLTDADFILLSEQSYALADIEAAVANSKENVIDRLRTNEFFPARLCAEKLAENIVEMFAQAEDRPIVLSYDDKDGFTEDKPEDVTADADKSEKADA
jgi:hypothetical protein